MNINPQECIDYINNFIYPFFRVLGFFITAPIISFTNIDNKIKLGLALIITFTLAPVIGSNYHNEIILFSSTSYYLIALEFLVGLSLGFIMQMFFQLFVFGGKITATTAFLGFAEVNETTSNSNENVSLIGQMYLIMVYLIFLSLDGHLLIISILQTSFEIIKTVNISLNNNIFWEIVLFGYYIFAGGLLLAIPAVVSLLIVNITFGVITKVAPQLNLFAVGFPAMLIIGLVILLFSLAGVSEYFLKYSDEMLKMIESVIIKYAR